MEEHYRLAGYIEFFIVIKVMLYSKDIFKFQKLPIALPILLPTGTTSGRNRLASGSLMTLFDGAQDSIPCMAP